MFLVPPLPFRWILLIEVTDFRETLRTIGYVTGEGPLCYPFVSTKRSVFEDWTPVKRGVANEALKEVGLLRRRVRCTIKGKGEAIPLHAWTGPEGPSRLRLPDFKTICT